MKLFLTFLFLCGTISAQGRESSAPFITGDTFRAYCDYIYDETDQSLNPLKVRPKSTIFVKTDYLDSFFEKKEPFLRHPYILVTHNGDLPVPRNHASQLNNPKMIAWFAQNVENISHPKLHPIPIGIANKYWEHGNTEIFSQKILNVGAKDRRITLYLNFSLLTYPHERNHVYQLFINNPLCVQASVKPLGEYLDDLSMSKFVLSPRGNGLDCHRTWEALLLGAYPIVRSSSLDPLFDGLPVCIIHEWEEVTPDYMRQKCKEFKAKSFNLEKLYINYWINLINSYKTL